MGPRSRLFAVSLLLLSLFGLASGPWLHRSLESLLTERIEGELLRQAGLAASSLEAFGADRTDEELARWAIAAGERIQTRITLVAGDGSVVAESDVPLSEYHRIGSHGDRPEVVQSRREGVGLARRASATIGMDMLYLAVPVDLPRHAPATLRVSLPLAEVEDALRALRWLLMLAAALGILVAGGMTALASNLMNREERRTVATVLGSMEEGVLALDRDGLVALCNPAARRRLELSEDVEGDRLPSDERLTPLVAVLAEAAAGRTASTEFSLSEAAPPAGQIRPPTILHATATPLRSGGAVAVLLDVTRVRRLERVRRDFVANVSHELRTPLSVIQANTEALLGGALAEPELAERFLGHIQRTTARLGNLVADLLSLSRIEAGGGVQPPERVRLSEELPRWLSATAPQAAARGTTVEADLRSGLVALADRAALEQVICNLLVNAIKYSPEHSQVDLVASQRGDRVRLEVRDRGPGVPEDLRPRLFERFFRVDPGRSRDMGGTGLGLAIVKHLVESMEGRVGMLGRPSGGSVFWVELPGELPEAGPERGAPRSRM